MELGWKEMLRTTLVLGRRPVIMGVFVRGFVVYSTMTTTTTTTTGSNNNNNTTNAVKMARRFYTTDPSRNGGDHNKAKQDNALANNAKTTATTIASKPALHVRIWKRVKEEARHYWSGTKVLGNNMRISLHFLLRLARGEILSRREKKLLELTVADTIRLVPFIVIAVVPFMEFTLPFLLKIFPNMLPSTYTSKDQAKGNQNAELQIRLKMANFLKSATARMIEEDTHTPITEDAARGFLDKAAKGMPVSNAEIIRVGKLLKDEFALDRIGREEVQAVARFFGISSYGPTSYVIWQLERKLRELRKDDMMIAAEGIEKLTLEELAQANFVRGMRVEGRTRDQMEQQLEDWMELADSDDVPPFLLLLSRSFSTKTEDIALVTKEAFEKLAKSERVEVLLDTLPDEEAINRRKLEESKPETSSANDLQVTFGLVDADGDGKIMLFELKDLMMRLGESYTPEQLDKWLRKADSNSDGQIDFKEFIAIMRDAIAEEEEGKAATGSALEGLQKQLREARKEVVVLQEGSSGGADKVVSAINKMLKGVEEDLAAAEESSAKSAAAEKAEASTAAAAATTTSTPPTTSTTTSTPSTTETTTVSTPTDPKVRDKQ